MTLLEELRIETNELHKQLDNLELSRRIMSEEVTLSDYFYYLQSFYALHAIVEPVLYKEASKFYSDIASNQRLPVLLHELNERKLDLHAVDIEMDVQQIDGIRCIGAIYVMEGSRLGGRFIANHLRNQQAFIGHSNFSFLTEKPQVSWKTILDALETVPDKERDKVVHAAKYMFKFVRMTLEKAVQKINEENSI